MRPEAEVAGKRAGGRKKVRSEEVFAVPGSLRPCGAAAPP